MQTPPAAMTSTSETQTSFGRDPAIRMDGPEIGGEANLLLVLVQRAGAMMRARRNCRPREETILPPSLFLLIAFDNTPPTYSPGILSANPTTATSPTNHRFASAFLIKLVAHRRD